MAGCTHMSGWRAKPKERKTTARIARAKPGETFTVTLDAASGGGYEWLVEDIPPGVRFLGRRVHPSAEIGANTQDEFSFQAEQPGNYRIAFRHARPWESTSERRVVIPVDVSA